MAEHLKGIAASDGIATAKAYLLVQPDLSFQKRRLMILQRKSIG